MPGGDGDWKAFVLEAVWPISGLHYLRFAVNGEPFPGRGGGGGH
jgi:hypothetical protein